MIKKNNPTNYQFIAMASTNVEKVTDDDIDGEELKYLVHCEIQKLKALHSAEKLEWEPRGVSAIQK